MQTKQFVFVDCSPASCFSSISIHSLFLDRTKNNKAISGRAEHAETIPIYYFFVPSLFLAFSSMLFLSLGTCAPKTGNFLRRYESDRVSKRTVAAPRTIRGSRTSAASEGHKNTHHERGERGKEMKKLTTHQFQFRAFLEKTKSFERSVYFAFN